MKYRRAGEPAGPTPLRAHRAVEPSPRAYTAPDRLAGIRGIHQMVDERRRTAAGWREVWADEIAIGYPTRSRTQLRPAESQDMTATTPIPTIPLKFDATTRTYHRIVEAGNRQLATTDVGKALIAAGFGELARELIQRTAANAANAISMDFEDDLADGRG